MGLPAILRKSGTGVAASALLAVFLTGGRARARDLIQADGPGDTYELLEQSYGIEVPDCRHMQRHITEEFDEQLGYNAFVFHAHVNLDDDRCINTDRQRTELRGRSEGVQGLQNSTVYYQWKFKLPAGFQVSNNFTHIFQIKAYGNGHGSGSPIMTLSAYTSDRFQITWENLNQRETTSLARFLNEWVLVKLEIRHANTGSFNIAITRLRDGQTLLSHSAATDTWEDGAGYGAPKFGIYRSLNSRSALRDEQVKFADFCVSQTSATECDNITAPVPPPDAGVNPPPATGGSSGAGGSSGSPGEEPADDPPSTGGTTSTGTGGDGGTRVADPMIRATDDAGCACRAVTTSGTGSFWTLLVLALAARKLRRREATR